MNNARSQQPAMRRDTAAANKVRRQDNMNADLDKLCLPPEKLWQCQTSGQSRSGNQLSRRAVRLLADDGRLNGSL